MECIQSSTEKSRKIGPHPTLPCNQFAPKGMKKLQIGTSVPKKSRSLIDEERCAGSKLSRLLLLQRKLEFKGT